MQLRHVIRALTASHTLDLLVLKEAEQAYVERQGAVRILRVPTHEAEPRAQIQAFQRALKRQLEGADYDVVHCRDSWSALPVIEARERLGFAVVYDLTRSPSGEPVLDPELEAQYGRDEEACLLAADLILAPTAAAVKALQGRGRPERVVLAPPGVDVDRFDWEDLPHPDATPKILYVGAVAPGRGLRLLARAFADVVKERPATLVLAGPVTPGFDQRLAGGLAELGIADRVEVIGAVDHDQVPALIATATVCVVPAAADLAPHPTVLYPTKLLEYMACQRAVVAPRRDTIQMVAESGREALLFEPDDPVDLARKLLRLLGEVPLRDRIARAGYERVRRDFTASAARRGVRTAYDVLARRFGAGPDDAAAGDERPRVELLADDDFEATVFEDVGAAPAGGNVDTAVSAVRVTEAHAVVDPASSEIEIDPEEVHVLPSDGVTGSHAVAAPPRTPPPRPREGLPRVPPPLPPLPSVLTRKGPSTTPPPRADDLDDGTPAEGIRPAALDAAPIDAAFVAGEIDVPTPAPRREAAVDMTVTGGILVTPDARDTSDPDTGSRTPPLERR